MQRTNKTFKGRRSARGNTTKRSDTHVQGSYDCSQEAETSNQKNNNDLEETNIATTVSEKPY
jgi:hypothetical protein